MCIRARACTLLQHNQIHIWIVYFVKFDFLKKKCVCESEYTFIQIHNIENGVIFICIHHRFTVTHLESYTHISCDGFCVKKIYSVAYTTPVIFHTMAGRFISIRMNHTRCHHSRATLPPSWTTTATKTNTLNNSANCESPIRPTIQSKW